MYIVDYKSIFWLEMYMRKGARLIYTILAIWIFERCDES